MEDWIISIWLTTHQEHHLAAEILPSIHPLLHLPLFYLNLTLSPPLSCHPSWSLSSSTPFFCTSSSLHFYVSSSILSLSFTKFLCHIKIKKNVLFISSEHYKHYKQLETFAFPAKIQCECWRLKWFRKIWWIYWKKFAWNASNYKNEGSRLGRKSSIFQKLNAERLNGLKKKLDICIAEQFLKLKIRLHISKGLKAESNGVNGWTVSWNSSRTKIENFPIRINGKTPQTPASFEKSVIVITKRFIQWVTGDHLELCGMFFLFLKSEKWGH